MPQSLSSILIHLVFSTKNREPFITPTIESELHPYMASIFRDHKSPSLITGYKLLFAPSGLNAFTLLPRLSILGNFWDGFLVGY